MCTEYYDILIFGCVIKVKKIKRKGDAFMKCPNCQHENEGGNFCENCGTRLVEASKTSEQQPNHPVKEGGTATAQAEDYLKKTKDQSKQYVNYFFDVFKKPYASIQEPMDKQQFIHAIITIVLFSLFIPLSIYFGLRGVVSRLNSLDTYGFGGSTYIDLPFMDIVIKPFFAFGIFIVLVAAFTFLSVKLGRVNATFKEVFTRYGILLIPFVFLLAIGLLLSLLKVSLFILFLKLGLVGGVYIAVPMVLAFYKKEAPEDGMDAVYGTLLTYILISVLVYIMGEMLFDSLLSNIGSFLW